jgi:hypothetical protein
MQVRHIACRRRSADSSARLREIVHLNPAVRADAAERRNPIRRTARFQMEAAAIRPVDVRERRVPGAAKAQRRGKENRAPVVIRGQIADLPWHLPRENNKQ